METNTAQHCPTSLELILKVAYGLFFIAAGADKFFNFVTLWPKYISDIIAKLLPTSAVHFLYAVGIFEIIVGILILTKWPKLGGYLAMAWLLIISLNLISMGIFYDIAVRDIVLAAGAYVLARMAAPCSCYTVKNHS